MPSKPIEDTLSFKFVKLVRAHRDRIASSLRDLHLYPGQELMLSQLWKKEGLNQSELAATCGLVAMAVVAVMPNSESHNAMEPSIVAEGLVRAGGESPAASGNGIVLPHA